MVTQSRSLAANEVFSTPTPNSCIRCGYWYDGQLRHVRGEMLDKDIKAPFFSALRLETRPAFPEVPSALVANQMSPNKAACPPPYVSWP